MEREPKIIIVSHKRADRVLTTKTVDGCAICVPESQAKDYERYNPGIEIIAHPDSVIGLPPKRQWILEHYTDVFMLDDDLKDFRNLARAQGEENRMSAKEARQVILDTCEASRQAGAFVYGFNSSVIPTAYKGLEPIRMSGYIIEGWIGFNSGHKLFYPPELRLLGDYWISLLNAYFHRFIWRDDRYSFTPHQTFTNPGGLSEFRNKELIAETVDFLVKVFGADVIQYKADTRLAKRKHEHQITLKIPF